MDICAECGETRPHFARELCKRCYARMYSNGTLDRHPRVRHPLDRMERWLASMTGDGCWPWPYYVDPQGYGRSKTDAVHIAAWTTANGDIPEGMTVDHVCHTKAAARGECKGGVTCPHRACANPSHLELVPGQVNVARGLGPTAINARKTHCKRGHPLSGENLYTRANGHRICRTCNRSYPARRAR